MRSVAIAPGLRLAVVGVLLLAAAIVFDAEPLWVPALAVLGLVVACGAWVAVGLAGARVAREIDGARVIEEEPLGVRLDVRGGPLGLAGTRLHEPILDAPHRLPARRRAARLCIAVRFARRGRRELAAPELEVTDPFGLFSARRGGGEPASVLVLPALAPVLATGYEGGAGSDAGRRAAPAGAAEVEIDGVRPLRPGTPASRIHWAAFARGAGLLERRMTPEAESRPLVALDARAAASDDALDAAVRAVGSLAVALARRGGCAVLLPGDRRPVELDAALHGWENLHVRLALLEGGGGPAPGAIAARRGPVLLVMARPVDRMPRMLVGAAAAQRTLVVPGTLGGRRAAFTVAGCAGYVLPRAAAAGEAA